MDILATSLGYMGLAFLKDAGLFQMLRVTPMLWCAILSIPILRQRVKWFQWLGMFVVIGGIFIKAIPLLFPPSGKSDVNSRFLIFLFTFSSPSPGLSDGMHRGIQICRTEPINTALPRLKPHPLGSRVDLQY